MLLDEATSAISETMEDKIFAKLVEMGITLITISHSPRLIKYHRNILEIEGENNYTIKKNRNFIGDSN